MLKRLSCLVLVMIGSYTVAYTPTRHDLRQVKLMIASMHEDIRVDGESPMQRKKDLAELYADAPSAQRRFLVEQLQQELEAVYLYIDLPVQPTQRSANSYEYVRISEPPVPLHTYREFPSYNTELHRKSVFSRSRFLTYGLDGDQLGEIVSRGSRTDNSWLEEGGSHQRLWQIYVRFLPRSLLRDVRYFTVFDDRENLAVAQRNDSLYDGWELGINVEGIEMLGSNNERGLITVAIHEIGHLLTVGPEQMYRLGEDEECHTQMLFRRCLHRWSIVYKFHDRFWSRGRQSSSDFVTSSASENLQEDIAETFLAFVVRDYPSGDSGADDKIRFLYQFDELVEVREEIREELGYQ